MKSLELRGKTICAAVFFHFSIFVLAENKQKNGALATTKTGGNPLNGKFF